MMDSNWHDYYGIFYDFKKGYATNSAGEQFYVGDEVTLNFKEHDLSNTVGVVTNILSPRAVIVDFGGNQAYVDPENIKNLSMTLFQSEINNLELKLILANQIDHALKSNNKSMFLHLTDQYNKISREGTKHR